jgi:hypothetical protein
MAQEWLKMVSVSPKTKFFIYMSLNPAAVVVLANDVCPYLVPHGILLDFISHYI